MLAFAWIRRNALGLVDDALVLRATISSLASMSLILISVSGDATATPLFTQFSTTRVSGEIELVERIDGIPENADFQVVQSSNDPVSFVFSITLDPESERVASIAVDLLGVVQQPSAAAVGWLPGNGAPASEPDSFRDVLEYSSSRLVAFGVLGDSWDEFIGGLNPGETSNRFFIAYEGPIARQLEEVQFSIWLPFDPYPDGSVTVPVPEPSSVSLIAAGCVMLVSYARRRAIR